ncbi:DUF2931 family protein, partial [Frigoriflavimonas asaccharolytica]
VPYGFPIDIYKGGLQNSKTGSYTSLNAGTTIGNGYWGEASYGMGSGVKSLPDHLNVVFLSYAEEKFYQIDEDLDYEKIREYFRKGYDTKLTNGTGEIRHENYDTIIVGFAPGGICIVWIAGIGMQIEVGRFQGKEVVIPADEIENLDSHDHLLFESEYRQKLMKNPHIVPAEVQGKAIPFGLWDTYRKKHSWKPVFELPKGFMLDNTYEIRIVKYNGEIKSLFTNKFPIIDFTKEAVPKEIQFSFKDKNAEQYGAGAVLDEKSILAAFKELYGESNDNSTAILEIKVNLANTFFTVKLKGSNGKEFFIKTEKLEVFKRKQFK